MKRSYESIGSVLAAATLAASIGQLALADGIADSPQGALDGTISKLYRGKAVDVTARPVEVPTKFTSNGPAGNREAQPIVFDVDGQDYYSYTVANKPNFHTTVEGTASKMTILSLTPDQQSQLHLAPAHLNQAKVLVDTQTHTPVGYSH